MDVSATPAPEGFADVRISGSEAEQLITDKLNEVCDRLGNCRVKIHVYADGSIDGELIYPLRRGLAADEASKEIGDAMIGGIVLPREVWISIGARYTIKEDDEVYRRYQGMNEIGVHYQNASPTNMGEVFIIFRKYSSPGLMKKFHRKAEMLYVRLHWNKRRQQPRY